MMKIRHSLQSLSVLSTVLSAFGFLLLAAGSAHATSLVHFIGGGPFAIGFDLSAPPDYTALSFEGAAVSETPEATGIDVLYLLDQCVRAEIADPCGGVFEGEDYVNDVTLTLDTDITNEENGVLILLGELIPSTAYGVDDVGFVVPGSAPLDQFQVIDFNFNSQTYHYLGFRFTANGQSATYRYFANDMSADLKTPVFGVLASRNFIPEPASALLLCVGLVGLQAFGRRVQG